MTARFDLEILNFWAAYVPCILIIGHMVRFFCRLLWFGNRCCTYIFIGSSVGMNQSHLALVIWILQYWRNDRGWVKLWWRNNQKMNNKLWCIFQSKLLAWLVLFHLKQMMIVFFCNLITHYNHLLNWQICPMWLHSILKFRGLWHKY